VKAPETLDLGGANQQVTHNALAKINPYRLKVDAGGAAAELQGTGGRIASPGQIIVIERSGAENVTLPHNAAVNNPFINGSGANITLSAAGDWAQYQWHESSATWRQALR